MPSLVALGDRFKQASLLKASQVWNVNPWAGLGVSRTPIAEVLSRLGFASSRPIRKMSVQRRKIGSIADTSQYRPVLFEHAQKVEVKVLFEVGLFAVLANTN